MYDAFSIHAIRWSGIGHWSDSLQLRRKRLTADAFRMSVC